MKKQHVTEQLLGQRRNERRGQKVETNKNDNMTHRNFRVTAKAVKREKFIALQAYLKKQDKSQTI